MKVLVLNGSPHTDGNTARLLHLVLDSARQAMPGKLEVSYVVLNDLSFKGCQGCGKCRKDSARACEHVDDLTPVLRQMAECDAWVLGTPVYMGQVSGQLKLCLDRTYGFSGPNRTTRLPAGKKVVIAMTQGRPDVTAFQNVIDWLSRSFSGHGLAVQSVVSGRSTSVLPGHTFTSEVEEKAKSVGAWLAGP